MRLSFLIPDSWKAYVRLTKIRRKYPGRLIYTSRIHEKAQIGVGCKVHYGAEIGARVSLGDYSYVNGGSMIGSGFIGKFCSIGCYCQIGMPEHPTQYVSTSPQTYGSQNIFGTSAFWDDYPDPPIIGNDVWIGGGAMVMQGVHIRDGAVVGAGAIVTRDVGPYEIVVGTPAKLLRKRFEEPFIDRLLTIRWWDLPRDQLLQLAPFFKSGHKACDYWASPK